MKEDRLFSDEELTAYLDGESDYARIDEINRALAQDSQLRARIEQLCVSRQSLESAFDSLLSQAPTMKLRDKHTSRTTFSWPSIAAAACLALVSFFIGWGSRDYTQPPSLQNWHDYVAAYQALYSPSTLANIQREEPILLDELKRVSLALGKDIPLKHLKRPSALEYKRAQVLGYQGQPLIQLAFVSPMKTPVALCIIRLDKQGNSQLRMDTLEGMSSVAWEKDGYAYLLIGGQDPLMLQDVAEQFVHYL